MSSTTEALGNPGISGARTRSAHRPGIQWPPIGGVLAAVTLLAAMLILGLRFSRSQPEPLALYQTRTVDQGPISARVTARGTVSPIATVHVGSQISGRITGLYVDFNSPVKAGQLIATIESSSPRAAVEVARAGRAAAEAALNEARANRTLAERTLLRQQELFVQGVITERDLDVAVAQVFSSMAGFERCQATLRQTQAELDQAILNVTFTKIVSPIDGVVISRAVDVGQTVVASVQAPTLFTIAKDLTKMEVDAHVAESDVGKLREGMEATFTVDAFADRVFSGTVRQIRHEATAAPNGVTYDAVIDVDNRDLSLRPSMTANVSFFYASRSDAVRIPNAALRVKPDSAKDIATSAAILAPVLSGPTDERIVWVLRQGEPKPHVVRVGLDDGNFTEMVQGDLRSGDTVITEVASPEGSRHES